MSSCTDLDKAKEVAYVLLMEPIQKVKGFAPLVIVQHPILESSAFFYNNVLYDLTDENNKDIKEVWINQMKKTIYSAKNIEHIFMYIRKSYRLTYLKFVKHYLSRKDFTKLLKHCWITSENPNQDVNVSIKTLILWFKSCNKKELMTEEEYKVYESFGDTVELFRGVSVGRNPNGLSWTYDFKTADWFAHRFDHDGKSGYIEKAYVNKKDILCYFNTRGEKEVIVDINNIEILK